MLQKSLFWQTVLYNVNVKRAKAYQPNLNVAINKICGMLSNTFVKDQSRLPAKLFPSNFFSTFLVNEKTHPTYYTSKTQLKNGSF